MDGSDYFLYWWKAVLCQYFTRAVIEEKLLLKKEIYVEND